MDSMDVAVGPAAAWVLSRAGEELFRAVKQRLLVGAGLAPAHGLSPPAVRLIDDYARLLENRMVDRIVSRLDEDRIATLTSAINQLRLASKSPLRDSYLLAASSKLFDIASLPERGTTAGFANAQLKSIAYLGIAAVHVHLGEVVEEIAEEAVKAVYLHEETARVWFGDDIVDRLRSMLPRPQADPAATARPAVTVDRGGVPVAGPNLTRQHVKDGLAARTTRMVNFDGYLLAGVDLSGLDLRHATFVGADLRGADLSHALLGDTTLIGWWATFDGANLNGAILTEAQVGGAGLSKARLVKVIATGARFNGAALRDADLSEADLSGSDLSSADLRAAALVATVARASTIMRADLTGATLDGADLQEANLSKATLTGVRAPRMNLASAILAGAQLARAVLVEARLHGADLSNARLKDTDLDGADLRRANLRGAHLHGLDLRRAVLADADLRGARYDVRTLWPDDVVPVSRGAVLA